MSLMPYPRNPPGITSMLSRVLGATLGVLLLTPIAPPNAWSQSRTRLVAGLGVIRPARGSVNAALYPELEASIRIGRTRGWGDTAIAASVGFWDDAVTEAEGCADCMTFSYRALAAGLRIRRVVGGERVQVGLHLGLNHQFVWADYVGGYGVHGGPGSDHRDGVTYAETGIQLVIPTTRRLDVLTDVRIGVKLSEKNSSEGALQPALRLGLGYNLR